MAGPATAPGAEWFFPYFATDRRSIDPETQGYEALREQLDPEVVETWDEERVKRALVNAERKLRLNTRVDLGPELIQIGLDPDNKDDEADVREALGMTFGVVGAQGDAFNIQLLREAQRREGILGELEDYEVPEYRGPGRIREKTPDQKQRDLVRKDHLSKADPPRRIAGNAAKGGGPTQDATLLLPPPPFPTLFNTGILGDMVLRPAMSQTNPTFFVTTSLDTLVRAQRVVMPPMPVPGAQSMFLDMNGNTYIRGIKHWKWKPLLPICFFIDRDLEQLRLFLETETQEDVDTEIGLVRALTEYFQDHSKPAIPPQAMEKIKFPLSEPDLRLRTWTLGVRLNRLDRQDAHVREMFDAFQSKLAYFIRENVYRHRVQLDEDDETQEREAVRDLMVLFTIRLTPIEQILSHYRPFYGRHVEREQPNVSGSAAARALNLMNRQVSEELFYFQLFWEDSQRAAGDALEFKFTDDYGIHYESPVGVSFPAATKWEASMARGIDRLYQISRSNRDATLDVADVVPDIRWVLRKNVDGAILDDFNTNVLMRMCDSDENTRQTGIDSDRIVRLAVLAASPYRKMESKQAGINLPPGVEGLWKPLLTNFMQLRVRRHPWDVDMKTTLMPGVTPGDVLSLLAKQGASRPAIGTNDDKNATYTSLKAFMAPRGHEFMLDSVLLRLARRRACIRPDNYVPMFTYDSYVDYDRSESSAMLNTFFPPRGNAIDARGKVQAATDVANFLDVAKIQNPKGQVKNPYPMILLALAEIFHYEMESSVGSPGYKNWGMRAVSPFHAFSRVVVENLNFFNRVGAVKGLPTNIAKSGQRDAWVFVDQSTSLNATWLINRLVARVRHWVAQGYLSLKGAAVACERGWLTFYTIPPFGLVYKGQDPNWSYRNQTAPEYKITEEALEALVGIFEELRRDADLTAEERDLVGFELLSLLEWYMRYLNLEDGQLEKVRDLLLTRAYSDRFDIDALPQVPQVAAVAQLQILPPGGYMGKTVLQVGNMPALQSLYNVPSLEPPLSTRAMNQTEAEDMQRARQFLDFPGLLITAPLDQYMTPAQQDLAQKQEEDLGYEDPNLPEPGREPSRKRPASQLQPEQQQARRSRSGKQEASSSESETEVDEPMQPFDFDADSDSDALLEDVLMRLDSSSDPGASKRARTQSHFLRPEVASRRRFSIQWFPGQSRKPTVIEDGTEVGFVVRFYIPDSGMYTEVEWNDTISAQVGIDLVGNPDVGLGIAVLARRALRTSRSDKQEKPHYRYRTRAAAIIDNGQVDAKATYPLYDPSDDYNPAGALVLGGVPAMKPFERSLNESAKGALRLVLDKFRGEMVALPPPLRPATRGMRLRRYTLALKEADVPAWVFAFEGILEPAASVTYVEHLLSAASVMAGWPASGVMDTLKTLELGEPVSTTVMWTNRQRKAIQICFAAISYVGNTNDYVGDVRKGNQASERFQVPLGQELGEGDCDDVAKETQFLALSIQRMPEKHPLAVLLREYDISMVTAVATSPALQRFNAGDDGKDADKYICHMYTIATPREMAPFGKPGRSKMARHKSLVRMGAFVLEGTNITSPSTRELSAYISGKKALKQVSEAKWEEITLRGEALPKSLDSIQYELPAVPTLQKPRAISAYSAFYRYITNAWTFDAEGNFTESHIMARDTEGNLAYGAEAYWVVSGSPIVVAQPTISIPADDKSGLRANVLRLLAFQHPIRSYHTAEGPIVPPKLKNKLLKEAYDLVTPIPTPVEYPLWRPFVEMRLVHENNMTAQRLRDLKRLVKEKGWVLQGICSVTVAPGHTTYQLQLVPTVDAIPEASTQAKLAMP